MLADILLSDCSQENPGCPYIDYKSAKMDLVRLFKIDPIFYYNADLDLTIEKTADPVGSIS